MSSEIAIEARDLGKAYKLYRNPQDRLRQLMWGSRRTFYDEFWALRNVDLAVKRGETLGVIGLNGAGKSTFLQLICGTLRPSAGSVTVNGRIAALLELGSGFNPEFTGRENVILAASVLGLERQEIESRFPQIEEFAGIGDFINQPVKQYSSGMYARLAFSVCAHVDADILIIDEILAVGDVAFQQKCMRYLHQFRERGTLLFVSHDAEAVVRMCDNVLWLDQGTMRDYGDSREMCRRFRVSQSEAMSGTTAGFRSGGGSGRGKIKRLRTTQQQNGGEDFFAFDPDAPAPATNLIEGAGFEDAEGQPMAVAAGGEEIEFVVTCRAGTDAIAQPIVAFVLRDRLGQVLFGDETFTTYGVTPPEIVPGQAFVTHFRFRLPYLASGLYSVDAFLFDGDAANALDTRRNGAEIAIQSRHVSNGLANIAMRDVSMTVTDDHHARDAVA